MKPSSSERSFGSLPPKKRELVHGSRVPENEREREGSSEISFGTHNRAEGLNWLAAVATSQTRPPSTTCGQAFDTPIDLVQNQHQQHVAGLFGPQAPSASAVTATGRSTSPTYSLSHLSRPYPAPTPVYSDQQGLPYPSSHVPPPYNTLQYVGSSYAAAVAAAYPPGTAAFLHPTFLAPGAPDSYPALLSSAGTAQGFSTSTQGLVATHHYLGAGSSASAYAVPRGLPLHPATLVSPQPLSHGVSAVHLSPESSFLHLSGRSSSPLPLRGRDHSPAEAANGGRMPIVSGLRRGRQLYSPHSDGETEGLTSQSPSNQPYLSDSRGQPITSDVEIRPLSRPGVILCPSTSHPSDVDREHLPSRHSSTHCSDPHPSLIPPQSSDATDPTYINWQTADFNYYANAQQVVLGEGGRPMLVAMVSAEVPGEKARSSYVREVVSPSDRRHENNPAASCSTGVLQPSHSSFLSSNTAFQATSSSVTSQNHHRQQLQQQVPATFSQTTPPAVTTPPAHFYRGSVIQMAGGELKRVEELVTEDFVRSAEASKELKLDSSTVTATGPGSAPGLALLRFAIGETRTPASIQVLAEHPFFVFGRGWASCFPEQTSQQIGLPCTKLAVGDVCISLALRSSHTTLLSSATAIHSGQDASPSGRLWEPASGTSFYQGLGTALIQPSFESHNHPQSHSQSKSTTATSSRESISSVSLSVATHNDRHQHHCEDPESHYTRLHHQHHLCRSQIVPQRKDTPGSCRLEMRSGSGGGICGSQAADAARTQIAHRDLVPHIVHKTVVTTMKKPPISRTMDLSPARRERPGSEVDLGSGQRWHPETRDGRFEVAGSQPVRKRRWSAPECGEHRVLRSSDSMQNRPMFISREVKVSIEGHSSTGR